MVSQLVILEKAELKEIWYWLRKKLTQTEIEWLKKNRGGVWETFEGFCEPPAVSDWEIKYAKGVYRLSFLIQDVLDAKSGKMKVDYHFGDGLPRAAIVQIAEMLGILNTAKLNKWKLARSILHTIKLGKRMKRKLKSLQR